MHISNLLLHFTNVNYIWQIGIISRTRVNFKVVWGTSNFSKLTFFTNLAIYIAKQTPLPFYFVIAVVVAAWKFDKKCWITNFFLTFLSKMYFIFRDSFICYSIFLSYIPDLSLSMPFAYCFNYMTAASFKTGLKFFVWLWGTAAFIKTIILNKPI